MNTAIVALHHEVLDFWAQYRRQRQTPPEVLSLDFHTDVLCALHRGGMDVCPGDWQDERRISKAVEFLHHDEHFDWALRAGVISGARIIALAPCAVPPEHPDLTVIRPPGIPDVETMLNDPESFRETAQRVLTDAFLAECLKSWRPEPGFILDIDCDFFLTRSALFPEKSAIFDELLSHAGLLTLSCENDWVKILRMPGENFSGTGVAKILEDRRNELIAARN